MTERNTMEVPGGMRGDFDLDDRDRPTEHEVADEVSGRKSGGTVQALRRLIPEVPRKLPDPQAAVFWGATGTVLVSALALGANRPISWLALAAIALVLFVCQMVLDLRDPGAPARWRHVAPVAVLFFIPVLWAVVQALPAPMSGLAHPAWDEVGGAFASISADPGMTWHGVIRFVGYAALFWIAVRGARDRRRAQSFIAVFAVFSGVLAFFGLAALSLGHNPIVGEPFYKTSVTASFVNRNAYAFYAGLGAMACLATLGFRLRARARDAGPKRRALRDLAEMLLNGGWIYLVSFFVIAIALFHTESRAGTAVSLVGMIILLVVVLGRGGGGVWQIAVWGLIVLPLGMAAVGAGGLGQRLFLLNPLDDDRVAVLETTVRGIQASPWLGHGLGAFQDAFRPYADRQVGRAEWDLAHNAYLENAFELGVPATLALLLALALIGMRLVRGVRDRITMRPAPGLALAALTAGALHSLVDFSLQMPATVALFAMVLGVGWSQSIREGRHGHGHSTPGEVYDRD